MCKGVPEGDSRWPTGCRAAQGGVRGCRCEAFLVLVVLRLARVWAGEAHRGRGGGGGTRFSIKFGGSGWLLVEGHTASADRRNGAKEVWKALRLLLLQPVLPGKEDDDAGAASAAGAATAPTAAAVDV